MRRMGFTLFYLLGLVSLNYCFVIPGFNANSGGTFTDETDTLFEKKSAPMWSFRSPFYLVRGTIPFWSFGGSAVVTEDYLRLTPDQKSSFGYVWSQKAVNFAQWEVELDFSVSGSLSVGADGLAFWYIDQAMASDGPTYGGPQTWNGLAVTLDTFDNDQKGDNPSINIFVNDGSWKWNPDDDGSSRALASCKQFIRNTPSALKIQYYNEKVSVFVRVGKTDSWRSCARAEARLPIGYHFAVTAATGGLADNHDITSFSAKRLIPFGQQEETKPLRDKGKFPPQNNRETGEEQNKAKSLADKLENAKNQPKTAESTVPQEQVPLPQPPPARVIRETDGTLQGDVRRLNDQFQSLSENLQHFKQQVSVLQNKENLDSQSLKRMVEQQAIFLEAIEHVKKNPAGGLSDAGVAQKISELSAQFQQVKDVITSKLDPKTLEINNLVAELQRSLNIVKGTAAAAKQDQENIQRDLAKQQQALTEHVETTSGFGLWSYVLVLQLVGGFGYMYYRKIRDDRNKKFY